MHNNLLLFFRWCHYEAYTRGEESEDNVIMKASNAECEYLCYTSLNNNAIVMTSESINFNLVLSCAVYNSWEEEISKFICWLWIHECKLMHFSIDLLAQTRRYYIDSLFCIQLNYEKNAKDMAIMRYWLRDIPLQLRSAFFCF